MASSDVVLSIPDVANVPQDYDVPPAQEIVPKVVTASFDGSAAAGAYLPTVEILAPSGAVVCRAITQDQVAAGASADVSFFHLAVQEEAASSTSQYAQTIIATADLRSYWPLTEAVGPTFADLGPSNRPLTIVGTPALGQPPLITTGASAQFSGQRDGSFNAKQYAISASGYGVMPNDGSITAECWINSTFAQSWGGVILCMDDNHFRLFDLNFTSTGFLQWTTFDVGDAASTTLTSTVAVNTGTRKYLACTFDGTSLVMNMYINGALNATTTAPSAWKGDTPQVLLAARKPSAFVQVPWGGTVDEAAFYSRALDAAEIAHHYAVGIGA